MAQPSGVDVSRWQGTIDWQAVKQGGISFASIRATIGDFFTNDKFAENWQGANDADIFRCAYHVLRPDMDAVAQIAHFESVVEDPGDLPHVLDVELTGNRPDSVIQDRTFENLQEDGDLIANAGGSQPPPTPPDLEQRVENLEKWAEELDAWARDRGYDGVGPGG